MGTGIETSQDTGGKSVSVYLPKTLLNKAEKHELNISHACRQGLQDALTHHHNKQHLNRIEHHRHNILIFAIGLFFLLLAIPGVITTLYLANIGITSIGLTFTLIAIYYTISIQKITREEQ